MTQRAQSPDGRPGRRTDSARPPRTRRGGDRAPYPGARTRTTAANTRAPARPEGPPAPSRRRPPSSPTVPTPATVWTCGPEPIDAHAPWPVPIVETITGAFTSPGAHVVLVDVDPSPATATSPEVGGAPTDHEASVAAAREAVQALDRTAATITFDTRAEDSARASRPFWARLVTDAADPCAALAGAPSIPERTGAPDRAGGPVPGLGGGVNLVLVSLPAHAAETVPLDRLALLAAGTLRRGGIVAVYTHSDWTQGTLADPTGAIVAACQHADLLYLQHIVALHTPVEQGRLRAAPGAAVAAEYDRARQRAAVRGLPAPHLRAHGDVLIFAQPTDPGAPPPASGRATAMTGDTPGIGGGR
ncbi:hypothetical protein [Amycolatopsis sp. PS_44_ISF1]|uniref:hypothetical protein n=1 Tax=Amycolatopsis sp. PS_44_ISF1 TaxID=2974917 RepID=UPI0028DE7147|nr:hypothetical protein [Amycolatopsis sp. PS_44_ISF1]MDT8916066.1 hypothetical protein [Amycolatopsis sp. PS_44_ISF1]